MMLTMRDYKDNDISHGLVESKIYKKAFMRKASDFNDARLG